MNVGADLGEWTVPLARKAGATGRVLAIEPNPVIAEALHRALAINNLTQAPVTEAALSDRLGSAELVFNPVNSGESRLGQPTAGQRSVTVPVHRLDDIARERKLDRLDLVKIDVERHEHRVLEGARTTLDRFHSALVIESGHEQGGDRDAIATLLGTLGYGLVAVLHDRGALPTALGDCRVARGTCAGTEAHNLLLLPRRSGG